ncbi:hypothetical protein ES705_03548 [subsurface metagenome]
MNMTNMVGLPKLIEINSGKRLVFLLVVVSPISFSIPFLLLLDICLGEHWEQLLANIYG